MKYQCIVLFLVLNTASYLAQEPRELTPAELQKLQVQIEQKAKLLKSSLETAAPKVPEFSEKMAIEFKVDTFRIEQLCRGTMEIDYSTAGMRNATYSLLDGYDKLLNKYYKQLLSKIAPSEQGTLKEAQRNWILYRDSEIKLINLLSEDKYSGGGTMQQLIVAGNVLDLTKQRVFQLVSYLRSLEME